MKHYVVAKKTDAEGCLTASVPDGISWAGQFNGTDYLIATSQSIPCNTPLTEEQLATECAARGLNLEDVHSWKA